MHHHLRSPGSPDVPRHSAYQGARLGLSPVVALSAGLAAARMKLLNHLPLSYHQHPGSGIEPGDEEGLRLYRQDEE